MNSPVNDHVVDRIADAVAGRLDDASQSQVEEHLQACAECAADFDFARSLRASGQHIETDRIVALSEGASTQENETNHLAACGACRRELDALATLGAAPDLGVVSEPRAARAPRATAPRGRRGVISGAILAVAAAVVFMLAPWESGIPLEQQLQALVSNEALPVMVPRAGIQGADEARIKELAFDLYKKGNYADATVAMDQAVQLNPEDTALLLYLGSSQMLAGDAEAAITTLEPAAASETHGDVLGAMQWILANAYLAAGHTQEAVRVLRELQANATSHRSEAGALLVKLEQLGY